MRFVSLHDGGSIPSLGLGTWGFGGGMWADHSRDAQHVATLEEAIRLGYTHIDTAEMYGRGHTEELVGQAIQGFERQSLFLTTKVSPGHLQYAQVHDALENSLGRLGTVYVDLYLIHWPDSRVPLEETFRALNELVRAGKVRYLGVSNFNLDLMRRAEALAESPLITNQVPYSLTHRRYARNGVLSYCQQRGILVTAYSPLKGGVLRNRTARQIAARHGATPAQVALAWLVAQPNVITIPKSDKVARLRENLGSLQLELTAPEVSQLNRIA